MTALELCVHVMIGGAIPPTHCTDIKLHLFSNIEITVLENFVLPIISVTDVELDVT